MNIHIAPTVRYIPVKPVLPWLCTAKSVVKAYVMTSSYIRIIFSSRPVLLRNCHSMWWHRLLYIYATFISAKGYFKPGVAYYRTFLMLCRICTLLPSKRRFQFFLLACKWRLSLVLQGPFRLLYTLANIDISIVG